MWPAIIGAGASIIGGLLSKSGQDSANETNIELANTAMQRRVKDLEKAGLNPMLAYSQGGAQSPQISNAVGAGVSSALQGGQMAEGIARIPVSNMQKEQLQAQTDQIKSQTMSNSANAAKLAAETEEIRERAESHRAGQGLTTQQTATETFETGLRGGRLSAERDALWGNRPYGGFRADVHTRQQEAKLRELEVAKQKVLKGVYEYVPGVVNSAKSAWDKYQEWRADNPWWTRPIGDVLREYGRK